jgi:hypothetical protein
MPPETELAELICGAGGVRLEHRAAGPSAALASHSRGLPDPLLRAPPLHHGQGPPHQRRVGQRPGGAGRRPRRLRAGRAAAPRGRRDNRLGPSVPGRGSCHGHFLGLATSQRSVAAKCAARATRGRDVHVRLPCIPAAAAPVRLAGWLARPRWRGWQCCSHGRAGVCPQPGWTPGRRPKRACSPASTALLLS